MELEIIKAEHHLAGCPKRVRFSDSPSAREAGLPSGGAGWIAGSSNRPTEEYPIVKVKIGDQFVEI